MFRLGLTHSGVERGSELPAARRCSERRCPGLGRGGGRVWEGKRVSEQCLAWHPRNQGHSRQSLSDIRLRHNGRRSAPRRRSTSRCRSRTRSSTGRLRCARSIRRLRSRRERSRGGHTPCTELRALLRTSPSGMVRSASVPGRSPGVTFSHGRLSPTRLHSRYLVSVPVRCESRRLQLIP